MLNEHCVIGFLSNVGVNENKPLQKNAKLEIKLNGLGSYTKIAYQNNIIYILL